VEKLLRIAIEQLERVKRGDMPTEEGIRLIGKINYLRARIKEE